MNFPQYRKYVNGNSCFKIISENEFVELKKMGSRMFEYKIIANSYPEKLYINDMLTCNENRWVVIDETEYANFKQS